MAGILKVDQIAEANSGQGVRLNHALKNSSGTEIMSAAGVFSSNINGGTISNATLDSTVTFPAGHVIQTKQFIFSKVANTTSGSMTQITDGSVDFKESITVKANSKILVRATLTIGPTGNQGFFVGLFRSTDGSSFSEITALHNDSSSPANKGTNSAISLFHQGQSGLRLEKATLEYLDTITSAGTYHYALYYRRGSTGRTVVNITPSVYSSGSTNSDYGSSSSVITLMEISG